MPAVEEFGVTGIFTSPTAVRMLMRYGNEPLQLWAACPGTSNPKSIAGSIGFVDWPERRLSTPPTLR